jgi:hypothetical protein
MHDKIENYVLRINNSSNFIIKEIPIINPKHFYYKIFWKEQLKRIIEGFWSLDDASVNVDVSNINSIEPFLEHKGSWRYMPPALYFYIQFGTIKNKKKSDSGTSAKKLNRPLLRDIDWEIFYDVLIINGFSGFENDDEYTCYEELINPEFDIDFFKNNTCIDEEGELIKHIYTNVINSKGEVKKYINPQEYVRKLHNVPLGAPVYNNPAKNYMILATRSLGKSYSIAGILCHEIIIDGRKNYTPGEQLPVTELFVGSGDARKSKDLMMKVRDIMNNLPGAWAKGSKQEVPAPFYKHMKGSIEPGGKWIHSYKKKIAGEWREVGSKSNITHIPFTTENPEAAAGGRYRYIVIEEAGLTPNTLAIHGSNDAATSQDGKLFGSSIYIGTGGSVEKIIETETMFRKPEQYKMLSFDDIWKGSGKIARFIPAIYIDSDLKDKNGNTDIKRAYDRYNNRRKTRESESNPRALYMEKMNYPLEPDEMFLSGKGGFFPTNELRRRRVDLTSDEVLLNSFMRVEFGLNAGEPYMISSDKIVITDYPYTNSRGTDTAIEIYTLPIRDDEGKIPFFRYIAGLDPVDDDDVNNDSSLQSIFILDSWTDEIVAEYTGRPLLAETYYEQVRRLLLFYNATVNYESNKKGIYGHFSRNNSLFLFTTTPESLIEKNLLKTQSNVGNKKYGTPANEAVNDEARKRILAWLLANNKKYTIMKNYELIKSRGLLLELEKWDKDINADRVSAMGMLMLYRDELVRMNTNDDLSDAIKNSNPYTDDFWKKSLLRAKRKRFNRT